MREIKFRAWDKEFSQMLYGISIGGPAIHIDSKAHRGKMGNWPERSVVGWNNKEDFEVMQYTGLKDRNGQEIYEGDIVKCEGQIFEVIYYERWASFGFRYADSLEHYLVRTTDMPFEVIGNVYQNPELLEAEGIEE